MGSKKKSSPHNDSAKNGTKHSATSARFSGPGSGHQSKDDVKQSDKKSQKLKPGNSKKSLSSTTSAIITFLIIFSSVLVVSVAIILSNPDLQSKIGEVISKYSEFQYSIVDTISSQTDKNTSGQQHKNKKQNGAEPGYKKISITNTADYKIRVKLDLADSFYEKASYSKAKLKYEDILSKYPSSPRALFGKASTLDKMAAIQKSNDLLEQSITAFDQLIQSEDTPDKLVIISGKELVRLSQFRGWRGKAVATNKYLVNRFPKNVTLRNELGVSMLLANKNKEAKELFQEVLNLDKQNGFAKVHLGFIYKTENVDLEKAVKLMLEGIQSNEPGTSDGRFYFHLGDALVRLKRPEEARTVYVEGAKKGLLLSADQRSLYNIDTLTARPWWTPKQTGYQNYIKLLKDNWKIFREEGLANMDIEKGTFQPEQENLRETGDWKQFTLYSRGKKHQKNCDKAPKTCALIDQIPDAKNCLRGQVKFSVMHPGVHVWPHTGPTNCRLRAHVGLVVPDGPRIRVVNETRTWQEGDVIIFDDSFEHEVWHDGKSLRLVLIVDFWHPEITPKERRTLAPI